MQKTKLMNIEEITLTTDKKFEPSDVINLYKLNKWSSAEKPEQVIQALRNSHTLVFSLFEESIGRSGVCHFRWALGSVLSAHACSS